MKRSVYVVGLASLGLCLALGSCGNGSEQSQNAQATTAGNASGQGGKGGAEAEQSPYKFLTIKTEDRSVKTSYAARIIGRQDVEIYPQVSGTLKEQRVNEGDKVRRGQVLFVIDQVPYQAALQGANANVQVAAAAVSTARIAYEAKERLHKERIISDIELQTSRNQLMTAEASLSQAKAAALSARNNLSYTTVISPVDGIVGELPYSSGALVGPSMPHGLTVVSDNKAVDAYFSLDESQILGIVRQFGSMEAAMREMQSVELELSDGTLYPHTGRVEGISGVIDRATGATQMRAQFPNPEGLLRRGSTGNVVLPTAYKDIIVVPQTATVRLQDKILVYKVVEGRAVGQVIRIAPINDGREYIVLEGLSAGEVIVAEGAGLIREGMPLK